MQRNNNAAPEGNGNDLMIKVPVTGQGKFSDNPLNYKELNISKKDSFIFYRSFNEAIKKFPDNVRLSIFQAIADYALDQKEPDFSILQESDNIYAEAIFLSFKPQIDTNYKKWIKSFKGGPPEGSHNNPNGRRGKEKTNQELTINLANVNENENVNENVCNNIGCCGYQPPVDFTDLDLEDFDDGEKF